MGNHVQGRPGTPSGPRVLDLTEWRKDQVKIASEIFHDCRAWGASIRDLVNSTCDADSTRPG